MSLHEEPPDRAPHISEAELRRLAENVPALFSFVGPDGRYRFVNKRYEEHFGLAVEDIVGRHVAEIVGADTYAEVAPHLEAALAGRPASFELSLPDAEGVARWMSVRYVPHTEAGRTTGCLALLSDITEHRRTEEALRRERNFAERVLETVQVIVLVLDRAGRIVRFNPYLEEISGHRLEDVRGEDWFTTFLPARDHDRIRALFARSLGGPPVRGNVNPIVTRGGEERVIEWYATSLEDDDGNVVGLLSAGQDVTERLRALDALRTSRAELARAARLAAIGELAAGIAHEVNNPINTILNCAQLLADGEDDPTLTTDIVHEGGRIVEIVRGLLDFARAEETDSDAVELRAVVERTLALVGRHVESSGVRIEVRIGDDVPCVRGRVQQLQQVLLNLVLNARDALASQDGRDGRIEITARAAPDGRVLLVVRDNGPGIPDDVLGRVFEPFFTTKREAGTGLGLSVSHGIVRAHGGRITVESEAGEGAAFTVDLPAAEHPSRDAPG